MRGNQSLEENKKDQKCLLGISGGLISCDSYFIADVTSNGDLYNAMVWTIKENDTKLGL